MGALSAELDIMSVTLGGIQPLCGLRDSRQSVFNLTITHKNISMDLEVSKV